MGEKSSVLQIAPGKLNIHKEKKKVVIHKSGKTKRINNVGKGVQDFLVKAGVLDSKYVQNLTTTLYCYHAHGSHHHLSPEVCCCFFFLTCQFSYFYCQVTEKSTLTG